MKISINLKLFSFVLLVFSPTYYIFGAEGMPQFNSESFISQLFWLSITFFSLYMLLSLSILPRIRENLRLRKNKIANNIERAEKIQAEIDKMAKEYNAKIEEAKNKANLMIKRSLVKSANEYNNQLNIIKKQILNKQLAVEKNIETYKATTEKTIFENALSTCATILSKLNYNNLTKEEIEILLREFKPTDNK